MVPGTITRAWLASGLALLAALAPCAELQPRAQRALDRLAAEQSKLEAEYAKGMGELETHAAALREQHLQELAEARADAITDLKRATSSRDPIAEQALVQREILRLDPEDKDARAFFTVLGTLEQELAAVPEPQQAVSVDLAAATLAPPTAGDLLAAGKPFRVYRSSGNNSQGYIVDYRPDEVTMARSNTPDQPYIRSLGPPAIKGDTIHLKWANSQGWMEIPTALGFEPMDGRAAAGACSVQQIPLDAVGPTEPPGIQAQRR